MKFEPLENEVFVDAKTFKEDYSGHYIVSNFGRCWSFKSNKFIGTWSDYGHWNVGLSKNNKPEKIMIGRLMLISFGIPIPQHLKDLPTSKIDTMHLDGDSHNNHLDNFAWGSRKENQNEINARRRRSEARKGKEHKKGKDSPCSKPILQLSKDDTFIREWASMADVQRELGINKSSISRCASGKRPSAGGYIWKYK